MQLCNLSDEKNQNWDQIEVFKIMQGDECLDKNKFFRLKTGNKVRGHKWELTKEHFNLDIRKYAFSQRTVNEWNKLPGECVNATRVNTFKNKLDDYLKITRQVNNSKYREYRTQDTR